MTGPAVPVDDRLREALLTHHPIMRSETGPFSGCRCGAVGLGQDVIAHVVGELRAYGDLRAAEEIERLADERTWTTEHDNEVVSTRDLYEQVARLRGELEPVTFDFPPDAALTAREEAGR